MYLGRPSPPGTADKVLIPMRSASSGGEGHTPPTVINKGSPSSGGERETGLVSVIYNPVDSSVRNIEELLKSLKGPNFPWINPNPRFRELAQELCEVLERGLNEHAEDSL